MHEYVNMRGWEVGRGAVRCSTVWRLHSELYHLNHTINCLQAHIFHSTHMYTIKWMFYGTIVPTWF